MLTSYSHSKFITKILNSDTGEQYKVVFLVAIVNGEVMAKVVSAEQISRPNVVCLPEAIIRTPVTFIYTPISNPVVSLFNSLFFFNSQPTRAPSL